ncbi:helix-turn-helix domain-containing protein [Mitsuokella sp. WILCCON 0060]|uniref:helix-turn-helix domain-containing protein n=1 Tax=unclassified Mitsuokella TaxID=2637239 RepID=UPI003F0CAD3D
MMWEEEDSKQARMLQEIQRRILEINMERRELSLPHNPYDQEEREFSSIEQGDSEGLKKALAEKRTGTMTGKLADTPLRSAKNIGIVILTLASRAAIRGGLDPETAFTVEDAYSQQLEKLETEEEVDKLAREAEFYYTSLVAKLRQAKRDDDLTARCKNYIQQHIQEPLRLNTIANDFNLSTDYLSAHFSQITGVPLKEYILQAKIRQATDLLRYTDQPINIISSYLSFSSQSHFGSVFQKYTGLTPKKYRNKYKE